MTNPVNGTRAAHAGGTPDGLSVAPVIYPTSTFRAESPEDVLAVSAMPRAERFYTRHGNPTINAAAAAIAELEGAETGLVAASGMGAVSGALLGLLRAGDHVVAQRNHYPGAMAFLRDFLPRFGVATTLADQADPDSFRAALRPETRVIYIETPSNPVLRVTDIPAIVALGREHGIVVVADNTFATPFNQRPIELGVDVVVHSATKALGGHSDVTAGAIVGTRELMERIWTTASVLLGSVLGPIDAYLLLRGVRTLPLRVARQNETALAIATWLESNPAVTRVNYPGLASHPQHDLARRQMSGFGGLLSFDLAGGAPAADSFLRRLQLFTLAPSLGGVESLVAYPGAISAKNMSPEQLAAAGIGAGLIRLSIGLEEAGDLIGDLDRALRPS